ncbi:MAG: GtrA family protein [Cryobacterium sp.]|nr:GtrA family protein [Oligoflexia bacterium]
MSESISVPLTRAFGRAQIASLAATAVDFGTLFFATEVLGVWYVVSTGLGALFGAITNFVLNRYWSFEASHLEWGPQARRYALVSGGSLGLNMLGVYTFTEFLGVKYGLSKVLTSLLVGLLFNFPLHRRYVFK